MRCQGCGVPFLSYTESSVVPRFLPASSLSLGLLFGAVLDKCSLPSAGQAPISWLINLFDEGLACEPDVLCKVLKRRGSRGPTFN